MESEQEIVVNGDEEFYEKIEAPKFVDFTVSDDRYRVDDRFWFCLRVGCDRKHEEEIDHEAISKDFVLRVMAARSPNVGLRKMLNRNTYSAKDRCPLSAPAKPTKSRLPKLAVPSAIPEKIIDTKEKTKPIKKVTSTPKLPKAKQVAAKYMTTPSRKIVPTNTNKSFRSAQNPKPENIAVPKNRIVAKALFKSPKKGICVKTSAELRTPLTKICEGMKKLSVRSQGKRILGYSSKSLRDIKRRSICKNKSKVNSLLRKSSTKEQKSKSLRDLKKNTKGDLPKVVNGKDSTDTKSSISDGNNTNTASESTDAEERPMVKMEEGKEIGNGNLEEKMEACSEKERHEDEGMENDDKENAKPDNHKSTGRNALEMSQTKMNKKIVKTQDRNLKEGPKAAATVAQAVKYKKPKPTNPKPFRLRTDERGTLREANVERKAPLKKTEALSDKKNEKEIEKQNTPAERNQKLRQQVQNCTTPQRRPDSTKQCKNEREILGEISEKSSTRKTKPSLQPHFMMPIGGASTRKTIASDVKETSTTPAGERSHNARSASHGKRSMPTTKEPNFQSVKVQKSSAKKAA